MRRVSILAGLTGLALALAGCGGSGGVSVPPAPGPTATATLLSAAPPPTEPVAPVAGSAVPVTLNVVIPAANPNVTGLTVTAGLIDEPRATTSGPCAPSGCSLTVTTPAGRSSFTLALTGSKGIIDAGTFNRFVLNAAQTLGVSFGGTVATIGISADPTQLTAGTAGSSQLTLIANDASGNRIIGQSALATPVTVAASDNQTLAQLSATAIRTFDQRIVVTYQGSGSGYVTYTPALNGTAGLVAGIGIGPAEDDEIVGGQSEAISGAMAPSNEMNLALYPGERSYMGHAARVVQANLPASFSLLPQMPVPGNQGKSNSCSGWSASYAVMSTIVAAHTKLGPFANPVDLTEVYSPSFVYNQINGGKAGYAYMDDALTILLKKGDVTWSVMPFSPADYLTQPTAAILSAATAEKISDWSELAQGMGNIAAVKTAISSGTPVLVRTSVDAAFEDLGPGEVWNNVETANRSGHFMALVGWNDAQSAFLLYNSHGTTWGTNGVGLLSYEGWANGLGTYTWTVEP